MSLGGVDYQVCDLQSNQLDTPLGVTFEQASARLLKLDRLDAEPDGYFVVAGESASGRWQVDGHLYDRGSHLLWVELKGNCPQPVFDDLLTAVGWPRQPLLFQLVREAVILAEPDFRRYASRQN